MQRKRRTTAWMLSWLCVLVIGYASLYPFDDWRNQDIAPWFFVTAPWPKYNTWFDIISNFLGYVPLGFWLCLAGMRSQYRRWTSGWMAVLAACGLSFCMESLQSYLPVRVPSRLDWLMNTAGGVLGASVAVVLERRGWLYRWTQFRRNWLSHDAGVSLVLLALWPLALLYPVTVPLGLGHVADHLRRFLIEWNPEWEGRLANAMDVLSQPLTPALEMLCVALGLLVPGLLAVSLCRKLGQRLSAVVVTLVLAILGSALSATLTYGPEHAWYWLTPQSVCGLAVGLCALMAMLQWPQQRLVLCLFLVLSLLLMVLNLSPVSTYYEQTMQTWEQGRFIRFHGLTPWLNWSWPWALLVWSGWHLRQLRLRQA